MFTCLGTTVARLQVHSGRARGQVLTEPAAEGLRGANRAVKVQLGTVLPSLVVTHPCLVVQEVERSSSSAASGTAVMARSSSKIAVDNNGDVDIVAVGGTRAWQINGRFALSRHRVARSLCCFYR